MPLIPYLSNQKAIAQSTEKRNRKQYEQAFHKALKQLNPAQQLAVDTIEGPVLVMAGPGSGKTHVLATRIGRILQQTDTTAQNILCLTFTDSGVQAMRQRLLSLIGPEAHRVHIYTFHSFCNTIIQDHLFLFGRQGLESITELEQVELIRSIIDELPVDHPLRYRSNDPYFFEQKLKNLFQQMKQEHWSPAYIQEQIEAYLDSLPQRPDYIYQRNTKTNKKGDLKKWKIDEAQNRMSRLRAAADLFITYNSRLLEQGRYDYDDMILWVLEAFKEHPSLLRGYQERYLYVLIDEYQDTNGAQNDLIQQLTEYWENPNIFIVGDDDQSIYEFQGARLKNLFDFQAQYADHLTQIVLEQNYRSYQGILDIASHSIEFNQLRLASQSKELKKSLQAFRPSPDEGAFVQLTSYADRFQEDVDIIQQIEQRRSAGHDLSKIAIIYARHRQANRIMELLEKKGIPYQTKRPVNILNLPFIQNLRQLMDYLQTEMNRSFSGEHLIFRILHFPFLGVDVGDLARLGLHIGQIPYESRPRWRTLIQDGNFLSKAGVQNPSPILRFGSLIQQLIQEVNSISLPRLVELLMNRSGLVQWLLRRPNMEVALQAMHTFFQFVKEETLKNPRLNLKRILGILKSMDDNKLPLRLQKTLQGKNGVQLLTAHSAKGLEFKEVFIIDVVQKGWEPGKGQSFYRFSLPDTLTFSGEADALEARRRLFYVAMTRAEDHLHISYSNGEPSGKPEQRSQFIDELLEEGSLEIQSKIVDKAQLIEAHTLLLQEVNQPSIPIVSPDAVANLLEGFSLSVSGLNQYLRCPISFFYENVLRLPSIQSAAATYGEGMHQALRRLYETIQRNPERAKPTLATFLGYYEESLRKMSGYLAPEDFKRRLETGQMHLTHFYEHRIGKPIPNQRIEYPIRQVELNGVPLSGILDRVDIYSDRVEIVDYKTGYPRSTKMYPFSEKHPQGGLYFRQLLFYKILYDLKDPVPPAVKGTIMYLEPDSKGTYAEESIIYEPDHVEQMKNLIQEVYQKIQNQDFQTGCGEENCVWCNFARQLQVPHSFADVDKEELDDRR